MSFISFVVLFLLPLFKIWGPLRMGGNFLEPYVETLVIPSDASSS